MQQREGEREKRIRLAEVDRVGRAGGKKEKERERKKVAGRRSAQERRECWQSMLLIRKARPLLWDQPSSRIRGEPSLRGKNGEKARGGIARGRKRRKMRGWKTGGGGGRGAREGETEKRARGLFLARPTSGKTPLIGTWLPVGATNSAVRAGGMERGKRMEGRQLFCLHGGDGGGDGEERRRWKIERGKVAVAVPVEDEGTAEREGKGEKERERE